MRKEYGPSKHTVVRNSTTIMVERTPIAGLRLGEGGAKK